ncbi:glycosyltransferase family 39 protein [Anaerolineales bacterium HSG6]|nr:glycosyltransferase family 39 protein [Anaerolineales bacterium HSG6]
MIQQSSRHHIILAVVFFGATVLRLINLGQPSQWNDEAISAFIARGTTTQILTNQFHSLHPPGYYLFLHGWSQIFGTSDFWLRLPSALMGVMSVMMIYLLGRAMFKPNTGLWAAILTSFMPFHLFYSQELRMYSQLFLLTTIVFFCQVKLWQGTDKRYGWWLLYLLAGLWGLYTHYFFILIIGVFGLYFILRQLIFLDKPSPPKPERLPSWLDVIGVHLVMLLLYLPIIFWVRDQLSQSQDYWIQEASLGQFLSIPLAFTIGQFLPPTLLVVGYGFVLMLLIVILLQAGRTLAQKTTDAPFLLLVLMAYWLPVLIMFGVSLFWTPLTLPRLMMVAAPGLYLLLAWGVTRPKEAIVNMALIIPILLIGLVADYNWLFNPEYTKPPAREAALFIQSMAQSDEAIIHANDSSFRLFLYYTPDLDHRFIWLDKRNRQIRPDVFELMGGRVIEADAELPDMFWLVLFQDFNAERQETLFQEYDTRYNRLEAHNIGGIRIYRYQQNQIIE